MRAFRPIRFCVIERAAAGRLAILLVATITLTGCPELNTLREDNAQLRMENNTARQENAQLQRRLTQSEQSRVQLTEQARSRIDEQENEYSRLRSEAETMQNASLERERALVLERDQAREQIRTMEEQGQALEQDRQGLEAGLRDKDNTNAQLSQRLAATEAELIAARKQVEQSLTLSAELTAARQQADLLNRQLAQTSAALEAASRLPAPTVTNSASSDDSDVVALGQVVMSALDAEKDATKALGLVLTTDQEAVRLTIPAERLFDAGTIALKSAAEQPLGEIADALSPFGSQARVVVAGHSDNVPVENLPVYNNSELSFRRAFAVALAIESVAPELASQVEVWAMGETSPVSSNTSAEGRRKNRRVEILLIPKIGEVAESGVTIGGETMP